MAGLSAQQIESELQRADAAIDSGQLTTADYCARRVLESDPRNGPALNQLGIIAAMLGLSSHAHRYFRTALDSGYPGAQDNLHRLSALPPQPEPSGDRYLLIKAWGFGFWSDVAHVLGALLLAEITARKPIVYWGSNSRFGDRTANDAFTRYFEPISEWTLDDARRAQGPFFPGKWNADNLAAENNAKWEGDGSRIPGLYFLNRHEPIAIADFYINLADLVPWIPPSHSLHGAIAEQAYRVIAAKYLKPQSHILAAAENFHARELAKRPSIAVHLRGSDKKAEMTDLDRLNWTYFGAISREDANARIFLMTDDSRWMGAFREKYGDRVVATNSRRTGTDMGIHYNASEDGIQLGMDVMTDVYIALRCGRFIGNGRSNVSAMVAVLKDWAAGDCNLLAPSQIYERSAG